jgi:hypothetical protein
LANFDRLWQFWVDSTALLVVDSMLQYELRT